MHARRGKCDQAITRADTAAVDDAILFDDADAKAGEVEIARLVDARHFRGFAADQGAAGLLAAGGDTADDLFGLRDLEPPGRIVVEKKECLGAKYRDISRAHRHQIDTDAIDPVKVDRKPQLGADAVGSRHQQWIAVALQRQFEQSTEAADAADAALAPRGLDRRFDAFHQLITGIDIDARIAIAQ